MATPIVPVPARIIQQGIERLAALRPRSCTYDSAAQRHIPKTNYGHVFAGWRAQEGLLALRIADEVKASRLRTATGTELVQLAASEFDVSVSTSASAAIGSVTLTRTQAGAGMLGRGTRFVRAASGRNDYATSAAAEYETSAPVPYSATVATLTLPISASRNGSYANIAWPAGPALTPAQALPGGWTVATWDCAGGVDTVADEVIRRAAKAFAVGRYGPVRGAIVAGALETPGLGHCAVLDDPYSGQTVVAAADASWASSAALSRAALTNIRAKALDGFGCAMVGGSVTNLAAFVSLAVTVRATKYLDEAEAINAAIRAECLAYFDDRADWYVWDAGALRHRVSGCDKRILHCTDAAIRDASGGVLIAPDPYATFAAARGVYALPHVLLSDSSVSITYEGPAYG